MSDTKSGPGRNSSCPCGSGRKYKQCCLEKDEAKLREERAKAAEKAAKEAAKEAAKHPKDAEETASEGKKGSRTAAHQPQRHPTDRSWKQGGGGNPNQVQRKSLPRKAGEK